MKYNDAIKERHENFRNDTVSQIEQAIETIKAFEGEQAVITAKKIVENSNLSRAVLYKEHSLKVWNAKLWRERFGDSKDVQRKMEKQFGEEAKSYEALIKSLEDELRKSELKNEALEIKLSNEQKRNDVYKLDTEELKEKNQKLLAECQRLQNKLFTHGID